MTTDTAEGNAIPALPNALPEFGEALARVALEMAFDGQTRLRKFLQHAQDHIRAAQDGSSEQRLTNVPGDRNYDVAPEGERIVRSCQPKYLIVTHGHADHFGGAAYLQEHYGVRVVLSAADWNLMLNPPTPPPGKAPPGPPVVPPKKDLVAEEGQPISLGSENVVPAMMPGHTPGSMGLIFDVSDGGKHHAGGLYGGTILLPGIISDEGLQQYLRSIDHFKEIAKRAKVDLELQNHPLYDEFEQRLAKLPDRKPGALNRLLSAKPTMASSWTSWRNACGRRYRAAPSEPL